MGWGSARVWLASHVCGFGVAWKDVIVPELYPREFRDDVVAVARRGEAPLKQDAKDLGISESCARPTGCAPLTSKTFARPGVPREETAEAWELRKQGRRRRLRLRRCSSWPVLARLW